MGRKLYEVEVNRTNISPKQFFTYCKKEAARRTNGLVDLEAWISFDEWVNPIQPCNDRWYHDDWKPAAIEICKSEPYDVQWYLSNAYNFIFEWFDGHGYLYAVEFER